MKRTQFSFEVPIRHLKDFDGVQDFYFALSFLVANEPYYRKFMQDKVLEGKKVILDNSFNELMKPDDPGMMIQLAESINATMVISPDDRHWTPQQLREAFEVMAKHLGYDKVIAVICNKNEYKELKHAGAINWAIPYRHRQQLPPAGRYSDNWHFLGLNNPAEILCYRPLSVDTSMPMKLAMIGKTVDDWIYEGCPHQHTADMVEEFFGWEMEQTELQLALDNANYIKTITEMKAGWHWNA
jgi:hypothetical protein